MRSFHDVHADEQFQLISQWLILTRLTHEDSHKDQARSCTCHESIHGSHEINLQTLKVALQAVEVVTHDQEISHASLESTYTVCESKATHFIKLARQVMKLATQA